MGRLFPVFTSPVSYKVSRNFYEFESKSTIAARILHRNGLRSYECIPEYAGPSNRLATAPPGAGCLSGSGLKLRTTGF
uniref:Uncharacterized protein n=1 Tax=Mycena chlorophos TaxID=658473 RepID=A0ABQ0LMV6_MYCCL|nr:predicted protein [Mycena chlorophos]